MPLLEHEKAIEQYYEQVKDKYPDINFERFREVCRSPFIYIKNLIKSTRLPIILVKHLGKFVPGISKVKKQVELEKLFFKKNIITEEEYIRRKTYLENYIKDYYDEPSAEIIDDMEETC